ncbi:MAG: S-methyl-5-thioribose-1-phosphate isomerase [Ignavibacteriales bacterium]|nr:S-methyl-5-thioribose-1-phosphate isomerase [Ignavibacteriales bacterium]
MKTQRAVEFKNEQLHIINQTKLPLFEEFIITDDYERIATAIERLEVRGAPAIGVAAAYGLALSLKKIPKEKYFTVFEKAYHRLASTRPTAVNLFFALNEIKKVFDEKKNEDDLYNRLISKAVSIHKNDIDLCEGIANNGLGIFTKKSRVLTHCNTGALATGGDGTALNVIRKAFENGLIEHVHVDETRPLLQGSRLTAWELNKLGIPFSINTDSTSAFLMQQNKVDLVIVGADRIAVNGDSANKIGTYNLAVLCYYHKIPFFIAAPTTTIDKDCKSGDEIKIELRNKNELSYFNEKQITKEDYPAYTPAFDITPNKLITAIITERSIHYPPFEFKNV